MVTVFGSPSHLHTHTHTRSLIHTLCTKELAGIFLPCAADMLFPSRDVKTCWDAGVRVASLSISLSSLLYVPWHRICGILYTYTLDARMRPVCLMAWQNQFTNSTFSYHIPSFFSSSYIAHIWFLLCFIKHPFIRFSCSVFIFTLILTHTLFAGWKKNAYKSKLMTQWRGLLYMHIFFLN